MTGTATQLREVDPRTAKAWLDEGHTLLIDVRDPDEYAREHIPGARLVPLSGLDPARLHRDGAARVLLHCRSGTRAAEARERLIAAGQTDVACIAGGIEAWKKSGLPTEIGRGPAISVMRQVQIIIGAGVLAGTALGVLVSPWFLSLSAFFGTGLLFAGATGTCGLALIVAKLPWNRAGAPRDAACARG